MTNVISLDVYLTHGRNKIDLIKGQIYNEASKVTTTFKALGFAWGEKYYMDFIRSLHIFTDSDVHVEFEGSSIEFDMMSFYKALHGICIKAIYLDIEEETTPDLVHVIIVASDNPEFDYSVESAKPHLFYENELTATNPTGAAIGSDIGYQTLFEKHTITDKVKVTTFNDAAVQKAIWVDIQHKEMPEGRWVSYEGYPVAVAAGDVDSFGDDATLDTRHHFHRVRAKTQVAGESSDVSGELYGV